MSGLLSGKYNTGIPQDSRAGTMKMDWFTEMVTDTEKLAKVQGLESIAKELDCTVAQLSLAWCLKNPFVSSVITGASRIEQLQENMKASEVAPKLTPEILARIEKIFGVKEEEEE
jgi:aryl-alcohol dehydrogenase-like predicted oxidoreductase